MISLKLWRALSKPPKHHPLFQYVLTKAKREKPQVRSNFVIWMMMLATMAFAATVLLRPLTWFILSMFVAVNNIYSARWVLRISRTLVEERESRRFDLLASLPTGLLGTSWALSTGAAHRRASFRWIPYLIAVTVLVSFVSLCGLSTLTLTMLDSLSNNEIALMENLKFAREGIVALPFVVLFYIDHIYSILTAIVFGQITTIDVRNTAEGQIRSLVGFMTIQVLLYTSSLGIIFYGLPNLSHLLDFTNVTHLIGISVLGILVFVIVREIILFALWRTLLYSLNADNSELALVLKPFQESDVILRESKKARVRHMDAAG